MDDPEIEMRPPVIYPTFVLPLPSGTLIVRMPPKPTREDFTIILRYLKVWEDAMYPPTAKDTTP